MRRRQDGEGGQERRDRCEIKRQREGKKAELELALGQKILKAFGKVTNVCMLMCEINTAAASYKSHSSAVTVW